MESAPTIAAFPVCGRVGFHISPFGPCTAFAYRCGLRARQVTYVTHYIEGFGRFVTSTTAPITPAGAKVAGGIASHWGNAPFHGAPHSCHTQSLLDLFLARVASPRDRARTHYGAGARKGRGPANVPNPTAGASPLQCRRRMQWADC